MSSNTAEALLDPKWAIWLNEPMDMFRTKEAMLTAEIGPEETAKVKEIQSQKAAARLQAYQEYQENKRRAFAEIGAHPDANFNAVKAAYSRVTHKGLRKFLESGEAHQAALLAGAAVLGQDDPNPLPNLLKARPQLKSQVDQDPEAFGLYMAARHAYLKAAASRDELAQEMGGDYGQAQERLRQMLQGAHQRLQGLRGMLPTDSEEFALPPAPEAPRKGLVPRLQAGIASSVAPTLEKIAEKRGGDPAGVRGAIGAALPRPSAPTRALGVIPTNLQSVIEDFARYGLVEGPLFLGAGKVTGAMGLSAKVAAKAAPKLGQLVGRAMGRAAEGGAILGGVTALSPASSTDLKERAKETGMATVAGAVATPVLGAAGDVVKAGAKKLVKPKIEPRKTTRFGEDATAEFEAGAVEKLEAAQLSKPGQMGVLERLQKAETPAAASVVQAAEKEAPETMAATKEAIADIRKHTGLDQLPEAERKPVEGYLLEAKRKGLDEHADDLAREVVKNPRATSGEEHASILVRLAKQRKEYNAKTAEMIALEDAGDLTGAQLARSRAAILQDEIALLTEGASYGSREASRYLNARKMLISMETYDYAGTVQQARVAKGGKLTPDEVKNYQKLVAAHEAREKEFAELEMKWVASQAENEKLAAEQVINRARRRAQITTQSKVQKEKLLVERESIKKELQALGFRVNDIAGVTSEGAYLVGKLATNYIRSGATTLDEVVKLVMADIPSLAERDVHQALLAKDPKRLAKARSDTAKRIGDLKAQAKILLEIEKAESGIFSPKVSRKGPALSDDVKVLRSRLTALRAQAYKTVRDGEKLERAVRTINDLQDQLKNYHRAIRKKGAPDSAELGAAKEKIAQLRKELKLDDEMIDLQEQLRTGEFKVPVRAEAKKLPPHLEKKQIEVRLAKQEIRRAIEYQKPIRGKRIVGETFGTLRELQATSDMGAVLRQGLMLSVTRPHKAAKIFAKSLGPTFSPVKAEAVDAWIRSKPTYYLAEKAKLFLPHVEGHIPGVGEELFSSRLAKRIPVWGHVVRASNRHMTTYLNLLRSEVFDEFVRAVPNATDTELKAIAHYINVATGRGDLGMFEGAAQGLSAVIWAPRFTVSQFQTPYMQLHYWKHPRVRKAIARDMAGMAGLAATTVSLAKLAGLDIETDPQSGDFGKVKYGNSRYDFFGGKLQGVRLLMRIAATNRFNEGEKGKSPWQDDDPLELFGRFLAYKISPGVSIPKELLTGKDIFGNEVTPTDTAIRAVTPMTMQAIWEAYENRAKEEEPYIAAPVSFLGGGVDTYEDKRKKKRK